MTLEERMEIIAKKANKDIEEKTKIELERAEKTAFALEKIKELTPRIKALLTLGNKCVQTGVAFPSESETVKYGYGNGYRSYHFLADGIHHHVGFMDVLYRKTTEIKYLGIDNGGCCGVWDFYTNGEETFLRHESNHTTTEADYRYIENFLKEFDVFEEAFYKWIDSLV